MTPLMLALVIGQDKVGAVLSRYEAAMRAMPCFEVKSTYTNQAKVPIHSDLVLDRNARLWFHATAKGADYILSIDPADGYREVDRYARIYDETSYRGAAVVMTSRINGLYTAVPIWLHNRSLKGLIPEDAKYTYAGQVTATNGVRCDHLNAHVQNRMGSLTLDISVMPNGLVAEYSSHVQSQMSGNSEANWSLSDYRSSASFPESKFANPIPDGYVPYSLNQAAGPIAIPRKVSLGPWVDSRNGKQWSPMAGKPQLIVIAGQDSPPSDRAVEAVKGWRGALSAAGIQLLVVSDASKAAQAKGLLFDPTERNMNQLLPATTPLFVLIDSSGKVRWLGLGFGPGDATKLLSEIQTAAAGK